MKCVIVLSFILTTVEIYISEGTEILYVLPDNLTDVTSCPSQPCATLSHLLDNGTLPVVSNVEYHFLPGEHHVPANMVLQNLHNFSIIGTVSNLSSPVVLVGCLQGHVINIIYSELVTIKNVMFKHCSILSDDKIQLTNLRMSCCFSCKIQDVTFIQYGFEGFNLIGESYLYNIKIMQFSQLHCDVISLQYSICVSQNNYSNYIHNITIDRIFIHGYNNVGLFIHMDRTMYHLKILIKNSYFCNMDETALIIKGRYSLTTKQIFVTNCTFKFISAPDHAIYILLSPFNKIVSFINCKFYNNMDLVTVTIAVCRGIGVHVN